MNSTVPMMNDTMQLTIEKPRKFASVDHQRQHQHAHEHEGEAADNVDEAVDVAADDRGEHDDDPAPQIEMIENARFACSPSTQGRPCCWNAGVPLVLTKATTPKIRM